MVRKFRTGEMPPPGLPRPDPATYAKTTAQLEEALDAAAATKPNPGRVAVHRLNRHEYTAAVRDLFGTVHNEGATKGILVTTSIYGPDAYEFAKGKPLTLLNGSELLYLLQKHGHKARIDLAEAKRLEAERRETGTPPH